jgi:hypothetical protein
MPEPHWIKTTKAAPSPRPDNIPPEAQWLSGEGDGSFFFLEALPEESFIITRYSAAGKVECKSVFSCSHPLTFNPQQPYTFTYLSHCREVRIKQGEKEFLFTRVQKLI